MSLQVGGEEVFHGSMPSQNEVLGKLFHRFEDSRITVAYEAVSYVSLRYDRLIDDYVDAIEVSPSLIPIETGATRFRQIRGTAESLQLKEKDLADGELARTRRQLIEHRCDITTQKKSTLLYH